MDIEAAIGSLNGAVELYVMVLAGTSDEGMTYKPECPDGDATSIIEITRHLISAEDFFRPVLRDGKMPPLPAGAGDWAASESFAKDGKAAGITDKQELIDMIKAETESTAAMVRELADDCWEEVLETPFMTGPRAVFLNIAIQHWAYHAGQVAYIQRLYGDLKFG